MTLHLWMVLLGWWIAPGISPSESSSAPSPRPAAVFAEGATEPLLPTTLVSRLLEKQATLWEVVARSRDQHRRYVESQAVLQDERLEWISERDRLTVTIAAMNRQVAKKDRRLQDLVLALYKLTHATSGQVHFRSGRRSVARDGRIVLFTLLARELREKRRLLTDLGALRTRRESVDQTVRELETLEENFRMLAQDAETLVKRSLFEIGPIERRLDGVDQLQFDAQDWVRHNRIREIRRSLKNETAGLTRYRGVLVRPVAGPVLPQASERPGVFLSGLPGDSVRAPEAGTVRFVGPVDGFGLVIVIEHEFGVHSIVGRVETPAVKPGEAVRRAQFIAKVPAVNSSSSPVYLELRMGREVLDPRLWLKKNE
jgi:hypothetical protein